MKRKTILLAGKTFVVSLPNKWAKEWGIEKGQELDLTESGPTITIRTQTQKTEQKTSIDISKNTERTTRWIMSALHKKGYDEIEIQYETREQAKLIQELLKDLFMGFTITQQGQKTITISTVSKDMNETFDQILRRAFLVTLTLAENTAEVYKQKKDPTEQLYLEKTNNQLTNFCQRLLNKYGHENPRNTTFMYTILWNLEKIADDYKYIIQECKTAKNSSVQIMQKTNQLLRAYYELFYKFDITKLNELEEQRKNLEREAREEMLKNKEDQHMLSLISHTIQKLSDFGASIVAVNN